MKPYLLLIAAALLLQTFIPLNSSLADSGSSIASKEYPRIVLYSTSWCSYCRKTMDYFKRNNIPYINKDIEKDDVANIDLSVKYKAQGVPLIVIGKDEKIIRGFDEKALDRILQSYRK